MRLFVDTNVFVAAVADDDAEATATATSLLNADHEFVTSVLNLMELRTVVTKKRRLDRERAAAIEAEIRSDVTVYVPDETTLIAADRLQEETLLYPMDATILACARDRDATLASFDAELIDAGATDPADLLGA